MGVLSAEMQSVEANLGRQSRLGRHAISAAAGRLVSGEDQGMRIVTTRDLIRTVAERWAAQYYGTGRPEKIEILRRLRLIDPETVTAAEVDAIIGNDDWTKSVCGECAELVSVAIEIGAAVHFDGVIETNSLCIPCLKSAIALSEAFFASCN